MVEIHKIIRQVAEAQLAHETMCREYKTKPVEASKLVLTTAQTAIIILALSGGIWWAATVTEKQTNTLLQVVQIAERLTGFIDNAGKSPRRSK